MTDNAPEALEIAYQLLGGTRDTAPILYAASMLRRQHARIEALEQGLAELLRHAKRSNEIMLHEAGIGVCDVTAIAKADALLFTTQQEDSQS